MKVPLNVAMSQKSGSGVALTSLDSNMSDWLPFISRAVRWIIIAIFYFFVPITASSLAGSSDWSRSDVPNGTMAPKRALVVVSNGSSRELAARLDDSARKYSNLLSDLGFDTLTIGPQSRPILDQSIRRSVSGIPAGASVAVFVTGLVLARDGDVFILPSDVSAEVANGQVAIDAETIRLSFVFRRLTASAPKEIVAVLDDCSSAPDSFGFTAPVSGVPVSVLCLKKRGGPAEGGPADRVMNAMKVEGLNFEQFAQTLRTGARDGSLDITTSRDLSRAFYFFDPDHFLRIDNLCHKIAIEASAAQARAASLTGPIEACSNAIRRWPYVSDFRLKRDAGLEQQVFQNSMKSCPVMKSPGGYKQKYRNGRYIREATAYADECMPPVPKNIGRPKPVPLPKPKPPKCRPFNFNGVIKCE